MTRQREMPTATLPLIWLQTSSLFRMRPVVAPPKLPKRFHPGTLGRSEWKMTNRTDKNNWAKDTDEITYPPGTHNFTKRRKMLGYGGECSGNSSTNMKGKCLAGWCLSRSSKPLGRKSSLRPVGSIPMHFRHFTWPMIVLSRRIERFLRIEFECSHERPRCSVMRKSGLTCAVLRQTNHRFSLVVRCRPDAGKKCHYVFLILPRSMYLAVDRQPNEKMPACISLSG